MKWTKELDEKIIDLYEGHTRQQIADIMGLTDGQVRGRLHTLGINGKVKQWTDDQIRILIGHYLNADFGEEIKLDCLSKELGMNKANICRKARSLGLTDQNRKKLKDPKGARKKKFATKEELRNHQSDLAKKRISENGHPRGALGMKHSEETKRKISEKAKQYHADPKSWHNSEEAKQKQRENMYKNIRNGVMNNGYSRAKGGKRSDLNNQYFRSSWEANYARYLNFLLDRSEIASWGYETKTFEFEGIKRGCRFYTPDFEIEKINGSIEWHEVKGWMDKASKTRLKRMAKYYPDEVVVIIDEKWFRSARKAGLDKLIPNWETNGRGSRGC